MKGDIVIRITKTDTESERNIPFQFTNAWQLFRILRKWWKTGGIIFIYPKPKA